MQSFVSWLTSQSGVSLLVALIALVGVLVTTWWNNKAADKRRRADQQAADQRRKDDQADEDARRKADDDRRERERLEQLQREDNARQRRAVADCVKVFKEEFPPLGNTRVGISTHEDPKALDIYIDKGLELLVFYRAIVRGLNVAELEVSNARVKTAIRLLLESTEEEYEKLLEAERIDHAEVGVIAMNMNAIGTSVEDALRNLVDVASREFLENPIDNDN